MVEGKPHHNRYNSHLKIWNGLTRIFFQKRTAFPRFQNAVKMTLFAIRRGVKSDQSNSRISLPKLGWMRHRNSREVVGEGESVTIQSVMR